MIGQETALRETGLQMKCEMRFFLDTAQLASSPPGICSQQNSTEHIK
jgi:hypothetical protein